MNSELIARTLSGHPWKRAVELNCFPQMLLSLKIEKSVVGAIEFVGGVNDLCGVADGCEKLVGEGGVDSIEAFASIVREARVFVAE